MLKRMLFGLFALMLVTNIGCAWLVDSMLTRHREDRFNGDNLTKRQQEINFANDFLYRQSLEERRQELKRMELPDPESAKTQWQTYLENQSEESLSGLRQSEQ